MYSYVIWSKTIRTNTLRKILLVYESDFVISLFFCSRYKHHVFDLNAPQISCESNTEEEKKLTSSLNYMSTDQLGNRAGVWGGGRPYSRLIDKNVKTTWTILLHGYQGCGSVFIFSGSGSRVWGWRPIRIQGFNDQKLEKKLQLKIFLFFFWSKTAIYLSLGLHKVCPSYRRSLQLSKEAIQHFKTWTYTNFCLLLWVIFTLLDPDPDSGSGFQIRIHRPDWIRIQSGSGSTTLMDTVLRSLRVRVRSGWIYCKIYFPLFRLKALTQSPPRKKLAFKWQRIKGQRTDTASQFVKRLYRLTIDNIGFMLWASGLLNLPYVWLPAGSVVANDFSNLV